MGLVPWKKKRSMYKDEESDEDSVNGIRGPHLKDELKDVKFIMNDKTNSESMRKLNIKWWE